MQRARGAGRETNPDFSFHHLIYKHAKIIKALSKRCLI
jgi:hypothetical protein